MAKKYNHTAGLTGAALERKLKHLKVSKKNETLTDTIKEIICDFPYVLRHSFDVTIHLLYCNIV